MNVYIATKFQNVKDFNDIRDVVERKGMTVSVDWTQHQSVKPFSNSQELCKQQSYDDVQGIENSDIFILYYDGENKGSGMFFELGFAVACKRKNINIKIYAVGENIKDSSMFMAIDEITCLENIDELKQYLDV